MATRTATKPAKKAAAKPAAKKATAATRSAVHAPPPMLMPHIVAAGTADPALLERLNRLTEGVNLITQQQQQLLKQLPQQQQQAQSAAAPVPLPSMAQGAATTGSAAAVPAIGLTPVSSVCWRTFGTEQKIRHTLSLSL